MSEDIAPTQVQWNPSNPDSVAYRYIQWCNVDLEVKHMEATSSTERYLAVLALSITKAWVGTLASLICITNNLRTIQYFHFQVSQQM